MLHGNGTESCTKTGLVCRPLEGKCGPGSQELRWSDVVTAYLTKYKLLTGGVKLLIVIGSIVSDGDNGRGEDSG